MGEKGTEGCAEEMEVGGEENGEKTSKRYMEGSGACFK